MTQNPITYPVVAQDVFGYLAGKYTSNNQLACVLKLNGLIEKEILKSVIALSIKEQPILGHHLVETDKGLQWVQIENVKDGDVFSFFETLNTEELIQQFIIQPFDINNDLQVKIGLFRNESDTLVVKINHACADAGGLKQYIQLLVSIYNQLFHGQSYEIQRPLCRDRSQQKILLAPDRKQLESLMFHHCELLPTVSFPGQRGDNDQQAIIIKQLPEKLLKSIIRYAHRSRATVNDLLLTAYIRALATTCRLEEDNTVTVNMTVDLRRYLPANSTDTISNISGGEIIALIVEEDDTFHQTFKKVVRITRGLKRNYPGLLSAFRLERLGSVTWKEANESFQRQYQAGLETNQCIPCLSNVGIISDKPLVLGNIQVKNDFLVGPALYSPGLILFASTYNRTLTITFNYYQSSISKALAEQFIQAITSELHQAIV